MDSQTKERPIIFSAPMVRALIEGRKTQTRRIVKNAHVITCDDRTGATDTPCPFGNVGDRLYVREATWKHRETGEYRHGDDASYASWRECGWKRVPGIHMPRSMSRLTLTITDVRVERLHEIGKDGRKAKDVLAEGVDPEAIARNAAWFHPDDAPALAFAGLWESIHGKGSWKSNPWVWALTFTTEVRK